MAFSPASPITGATVPGFTTPTYTIALDVAPTINGRQYAVTAAGGTQVGVDVNTVSKPFTITFFRPQTFRVLPQANTTTGVIKGIAMNSYKLITRKGVVPASNQVPMIGRITTTIEVPAGSDTFEPEDIKAMLSAHAGALFGNSSGIADTIITGVL